MSGAPPSYDAVERDTHGQGHGDNNHLQPGGNNLARTTSATSDTGADPFEGLSPEEQREFADEYRDLPEGWVKCWDPKSVNTTTSSSNTDRQEQTPLLRRREDREGNLGSSIR